MKVKLSNKKSSFGTIPQGWVVKPISQVAPLQRGFDLTKQEIKPGLIPVVYSNGVENFHNIAMAKGPGVITGRSGTLGKVHYVDKDYWPHNTSLWVTKFNDNIPKFIYYLYKFLRFERFASGSGVPTLNRKDAHSYTIALPSSSVEQHAIVYTLSDIDALINSLDLLIVKKHNLRHAVMQQLLSGKMRLPGFNKEWKIKTLNQIISRFSTGLNPRQNFQLNSGGNFYYVTIKNFATGRLFLNEKCDLIDKTAFLKINERSDLRKDDLLFSSIGRVGDTYLITENPQNWNINESVFTLRPDKKQIIPLMLFHLLRSTKIKDALNQGATGSTFTSIKQAQLKKISCYIPTSKDEQIAIAETISEMDNELTLLEKQHNKIKSLKQAMMQELLTGKTRLV